MKDAPPVGSEDRAHRDARILDLSQALEISPAQRHRDEHDVVVRGEPVEQIQDEPVRALRDRPGGVREARR